MNLCSVSILLYISELAGQNPECFSCRHLILSVDHQQHSFIDSFRIFLKEIEVNPVCLIEAAVSVLDQFLKFFRISGRVNCFDIVAAGTSRVADHLCDLQFYSAVHSAAFASA